MAHPPTTEIAPGIHRIPTIGSWMTNTFAIVDDDGSVTLVDCGTKSAPPRIVAGLAAIGKRPSDVQRIVLTHAHYDHVGGAAEVARQSGAPLAVHEDDASFVEAGHQPPPDTTLVARLVTRLIPTGKFAPVGVSERLTDGQLLDIGGGVRVVATPGHTPGHISLLHEPTRTVITGDAIVNTFGIRSSPRAFCTDFRLTQLSAHVLGELEYERAGFTHGPEITRNAREAVRAFLKRTVPLRE